MCPLAQFFTLLVLLFFWSSTHVGISTIPEWSFQKDEPRVIKGHDVPDGKYPFIVSIQLQGSHFCGGTILNDDTILTAAHCVLGQSASNLQILVGNTDLRKASSEYMFNAKKLIHNGGFNIKDPASGNDVAVIKLDKKIDFKKFGNKVLQTCLPSANDKPKASECVGIGWGKDGSSMLPMKLQEVTLPMQSVSECKKYVPYDRKNLLCAFNQSGGSSCSGDSGGPFICPLQSEPDQWLQFGIVSFGDKDCASMPGFYTRVSNYISWIRSNTEN